PRASPPVALTPALPLTVTGISAQDKVYDGTTSATIDTSGATLSGVLAGDSVSLVTAGAVGALSDKLAGIGKTVIVSGLALSGPDAGDYTIAQPGVSANITPAPLTLTPTT